MSGLTISQIETWHCVLPLLQPINLGNFTVQQRTHLVVRVLTKEGLIADCVTQSRGAPLDVVAAEVIAPRLIGKDALDVHARWSELRRELTALEMDGSVGRAWSALEICLHDLRAQAAGWPMWRLLGGIPRTVDVEIVEGYALLDESDEQFAERLAARAAEGYKYLKVEAGHYADPEELIRRLRAFRKLAGERPLLVLDFAWSWRSAKEKVGFVERLREFGVAWIEDPFARLQSEDFVFLRQHCGLPIGAGDEASRVADIMNLIGAKAIDVVRLDATTLGGYEAVRQLSATAIFNNLRVSFHDRPEVHEHCVFGLDCSDHVEIFPTDRPFDRVHDLLQTNVYARVRNGRLSPPDAPGTGLKLRDDSVAKYARRHHTVT